MTTAQFGDVHIFRPSAEVEALIRRESRAHLLSRFSPGDYGGAAAANEIIQHQFRACLKKAFDWQNHASRRN